MVDWVNYLTNSLLFDIPWSYFYITLRTSIIFCIGSGNLFLGISLSCSFVTVSQLFLGKILETFVILSAILLPVISPAASTVFWIALFERVLGASVADCLARSRSFYPYLPLTFLLMFLPIFLTIFLAKDKNPESLYRLNWIAVIFYILLLNNN